uniref:Rotatin N-terminal domain-containing protein n=1 Tax=Glossina morsitans morsitans TaxID=37546 RepID=A0A1B0FFQ0_GLOMM
MAYMIVIDRDSLQKLNHETAEIRLRTLEQISSKLKRALAHNEKVNVKPNELCKQLIRWFGIRPIQAPFKVLELLGHILRDKEYRLTILHRIGAERLKKELNKVKAVIKGHDDEFKLNEEIDKLIKFIRKPESAVSTTSKSDQVIEVIDECVSRLSLHSTESDHLGADSYETPWSKPSVADYTSMKLLADILINPSASDIEMQNALNHLQITMCDYPVEYLLQPPNLFLNLLQVFDERKRSVNGSSIADIDCVSNTLLEFLHQLRKGLKLKRKTLTYSLPLSLRNSSKCALYADLPNKPESPTQIRVEIALKLLLDACIVHLDVRVEHGHVSSTVWELIYMILTLHKFIDVSLDAVYVHRVAEIIHKLDFRYHKSEIYSRLRIRQMHLLFLLQDMADINALNKPLDNTHPYLPIVRDYTFKTLFPERYQHLSDLLVKGDKVLGETLSLLDFRETIFAEVAKLLINPSAVSSKEILEKGLDICLVVEKIQSRKLLDLLFDPIANSSHIYLTNTSLHTKAKSLLITLLKLKSDPLKSYAYNKLAGAFKRHIGCLMNGENYSIESSNALLLGAQIVGVPIFTELLLHLIFEASENPNESIKDNCLAILTLFLKSERLFDIYWNNLVALMVPVMPLLICCTFSEQLMCILLKLYDPDCQHLPPIAMLQGNIGFLFHEDVCRRSEALARLIYILNSMEESCNYFPNISEINDTIPNDLCLVRLPREYGKIFCDRSTVVADGISTMNTLFNILDTTDVEPCVRKSTLMQINVLCVNWRITADLCETGAFYLIMQALENSMQKDCDVDYPDTAIAAISILTKVLLYDAAVRCELAETPNIYILLLRALMMFVHDVQLKQDASICLFLLLFPHEIVATENSLTAPCVLGNLQAPVKVNLRPALCSDCSSDDEKLKAIFPSVIEENLYWRFVIARAYGNDFKDITQKVITKQTQLDISDEFKLTSHDVRWIRSSQPALCVQRILHSASNATDHRSLILAAQLLKQQLLLKYLSHIDLVGFEEVKAMHNLIIKYMKLPPGNVADFEVFEGLLDVALICIRTSLMFVITGIASILQKDAQNTLITLLIDNDETPIMLFRKITIILIEIIKNHKLCFDPIVRGVKVSLYFGNVFDLLLERSQHLLENRDLERVRCLLSVLAALSSCQIDLPDDLLYQYCLRLMNMSSKLRSYTQTGAQWHRDCLLSVLQLSNQMKEVVLTFRATTNLAKLLGGMSGHVDPEVRILAWSALHRLSRTKAIDAPDMVDDGEERKSSYQSGAQLLFNDLSYLPGGFMTCCLSTLLNLEEPICVRQLAGQLFAFLVEKDQIEEIKSLLLQHQFLRLAGDALHPSVCILSEELPAGFDSTCKGLSNCELLSSYAQICRSMSMKSGDFLTDLCTQSFMFLLYEVLKRPVPQPHSAFFILVADITRLYILLYPDNFTFLQRTLCRDEVWLSAYCQIVLLDDCIKEDSIIVDVLQFLMVISKDATAFDIICDSLTKHPEGVVKLFKNAFSITQLDTPLMTCALSTLSFLLIKSQPELAVNGKTITLLNVLNCQVHETKSADSKTDHGENNKVSNKTLKKKKNEKDECEGGHVSTVAEHISIALIRLYLHMYPMKACKFTTAPTALQQQISECLALLLKVSLAAQEAANNLKLINKVLKIFQCFFDEYASTTCTTFVRRYGETRKNAVIQNLQLLLTFLLYWHSAQTMIMMDDSVAAEVSRILIQLWPWSPHSADLKLTILQVCAFLSERSIVVCKQFVTINSSAFAHSILQLVDKTVTTETTKVKAVSTDCMPIIVAGLRVLMNCCSCVEGRTALQKQRTLNIFDTVLPFKPKTSRPKVELQNAWLRFWEIYSRYSEGGQVCHLNALCYAIHQSEPRSEIRLLSLRIIRNMSFLGSNRSTLITSTDFIYMIDEIVAQPMEIKTPGITYEEQWLICLALWKLMSGGVKFVAMIRGTKLAKHLRLLRDTVKSFVEEENIINYTKELLDILKKIFNLFDHS